LQTIQKNIFWKASYQNFINFLLMIWLVSWNSIFIL
jgi:hypothetical protein